MALSIGFFQKINWQNAIFVFRRFAPFCSRFLKPYFYFCVKKQRRFLALLLGLRRFLQFLPFGAMPLPCCGKGSGPAA
jgi:hypothetical protein